MGNTAQSVREAYDRVADAYARRYVDELQHKTLDRELLNRFATEVAGRGKVCDLGCGPGHIARYLHDQGTEIFGLDLSLQMVEEARKRSPDLEFHGGDMMALDLEDEMLAGIVAFYAIVNVPESSLPIAFREMCRVLQPQGRLLLSFHIGDEIVHPVELLGQPNCMDFFFFQPSRIRKLLEGTGFAIKDVIERGPYSPEVEYQSRRAYIFAAKSLH